MKVVTKKLFFILCLSFIFSSTFSQSDYDRKKIGKYVDFIENNSMSPVDYIFSLFERYDIVILGERDHREITQYELIKEILSDPRFSERVGTVMTEIGGYNFKDKINQALNPTVFCDSIFEKQIHKVARDFSDGSLWEKTVTCDLYKMIYDINKGLEAKDRIYVVPNDIPFSWDYTHQMTSADYKKYSKNTWHHRECIMAQNAINEIYRMFEDENRNNKVLIIYNDPHAQRYYKNKYKVYRAAQHIFDRFPEQVANVMVNWCFIHPRSDEDEKDRLIAEGKWDAAFHVLGNKAVGFDFKGSPFGEEKFKTMEKPSKHTTYQEVYTGFIFYKSPKEWVIEIGFKELFPKSFKQEYKRRKKIENGENWEISDEYLTGIQRYFNRRNKEFIYKDNKKMEKQIQQYLKP